MWKFLFFTLLFVGVSQKVFSQNIEQSILELLYNDIKKQNEYYSIKEKTNGVSLVSDPISGESEVKYSVNIDDKTKAEFAKFTKEEQIKILSCNSSLILLKDTLVIVDSIGFFPEGDIIFSQKKSVVSIIRKNSDTTRSKSVVLFAVGVRGNNLIITLSKIKKSKQLYNYYLNLKGSEIKLQKTSVIENKVFLE